MSAKPALEQAADYAWGRLGQYYMLAVEESVAPAVRPTFVVAWHAAA